MLLSFVHPALIQILYVFKIFNSFFVMIFTLIRILFYFSVKVKSN